MDPAAIECSEERGGAPSEILPYARWLAWRAVGGGSTAVRPEEPTLGVSSSGRLATALELCAERSDDGLLVGPSGLGPLGTGPAGTRIVWVADISLVPIALDPASSSGPSRPPARRRSLLGSRLGSQPGSRSAEAIGFSAPTVTVGTSMDVRVVWPGLPSGQYALRFTVLCRPIDEVTFENEDFDSSVSVRARDGSTRVVIQPYPTLDPVEIEVHTAADLHASPAWQRGIDVVGWDGTEQVEDRFSPGELRFLWDESQGSFAVTARVLETQTSQRQATRRRRGEGLLGTEPPVTPPVTPLVTPLVAPLVASLVASPVAPTPRYLNASWLAATDPFGSRPAGGTAKSIDLEVPVEPPWSGDGRLALLLWRTRALGLSVGAGGPLDREAFDHARAECVELAFERARGGPLWRALEGLPRWDECIPGADGARSLTLGEKVSAEEGAPAVEHAALLHAVLTACGPRDVPSPETSRLIRVASELSRWFQDSFWLSTPGRLGDRALPRTRRTVGGKGLLEIMALRPHAVIACSLAGAPVSAAQRRRVVRAAEARLLTPMGLRTLDFAAQAFNARESSAGMIFPWLLAPYVRASALAFGLGRGRAERALAMLRPLEAAPEAWFLQPDAAFGEARAVGAIGLGLHRHEVSALDRFMDAAVFVRSPLRSPLTSPLGPPLGARRRLGPASASGSGSGSEWVLQ